LPATVPSKYFFPRVRIPLKWFARGGRRLLLEQRSEITSHYQQAATTRQKGDKERRSIGSTNSPSATTLNAEALQPNLLRVATVP